MNTKEDATDIARVGEEMTLIDDEGRLLIPLETLAVLNWLGEIGVDGVESRLDRVATDDLQVRTERVKIGYADSETSLTRFGAADRAGARIPVQKPFAGNVMVLFPVKSANEAASLMLERAVDDAGELVSTEMGRDALTELCNMMVNGFVDEWATVFDTPFSTDPPTAVQNPELTLVNEAFTASELGLYLTARIRVTGPDIDAAIFVFPGEEQFVAKISRIRPEEIDG